VSILLVKDIHYLQDLYIEQLQGSDLVIALRISYRMDFKPPLGGWGKLCEIKELMEFPHLRMSSCNSFVCFIRESSTQYFKTICVSLLFIDC